VFSLPNCKVFLRNAIQILSELREMQVRQTYAEEVNLHKLKTILGVLNG
jgi:hypothetical protein